MGIANSNPIKFIASTKALHKWLVEIQTSGDGIAFDVRPDSISVSGNTRSFYPGAITGTGVFVFSKDRVEMVIAALNTVPDCPVTIVFSEFIEIYHIMI